MTPETKRRALLAATKLALVTTIGCSTSHGTIEADTGVPPDSSSETDAFAAADASAQVDAFSGNDAFVEADAATRADASASEVEDCVASLVVAAESVDPNTGTAPPAIVEESTECCEIVHASVDSGETWGTWPGEADGNGTLRAFCCFTVFEGNAGGSCTPWGPPMPPAMPGEVFA